MNGQQNREAFETAAKLVKEGRYEEARAINLLPSDRKVIEGRIQAASANTANSQEGK